jgi:hypothetical protein
MSENNISHEQTPHVSALLWETILGTSFEVKEVAKTRGRPRRLVQSNDGKHIHKLGDNDPEVRNLLPNSIKNLIEDYKEYVYEGLTPKQALEEVCKLYRVPYGYAFNLCSDEL